MRNKIEYLGGEWVRRAPLPDGDSGIRMNPDGKLVRTAAALRTQEDTWDQQQQQPQFGGFSCQPQEQHRGFMLKPEQT